MFLPAATTAHGGTQSISKKVFLGHGGKTNVQIVGPTLSSKLIKQLLKAFWATDYTWIRVPGVAGGARVSSCCDL